MLVLREMRLMSEPRFNGFAGGRDQDPASSPPRSVICRAAVANKSGVTVRFSACPDIVN